MAMAMAGEAVSVSLSLAFVAGVASLLSPCVLALVPAYMSYLSGVSVSSQANAELNVRLRVMLHATLFVIGFSAVFIAFGVSAGLLGQFLLKNQVLVRQLSGVIVIAFGLHTAGWLQIPFLLRETRVSVTSHGASPSRALVIGMAFAAGWTPCVGPILGSILLLASEMGTVSAGFTLLLAYSIGMALPFLAMAWSLSRFEPVLRWARRNGNWISRITGVFLIIIGLMLYSNTFGLLAGLLSYWRDFLPL